MQYVKLISVIVGSANFLLSCSGTPASGTNKDVPSNSKNESVASSSSNASFSVTIDGAPVSGNVVDEMQLTNTVFVYPASENSPKRLLFFLNSNKKGDDFYSFRFSFPDKEGEYKFTRQNHEELNCHLLLDLYLKSTDNFARYDQDSMTVVISKITSTRISGSFSGNLRLSDDTRSKQYKSNVVLTDGKFDIPFSTGNLRPE